MTHSHVSPGNRFKPQRPSTLHEHIVFPIITLCRSYTTVHFLVKKKSTKSGIAVVFLKTSTPLRGKFAFIMLNYFRLKPSTGALEYASLVFLSQISFVVAIPLRPPPYPQHHRILLQCSKSEITVWSVARDPFS